MRRVLRCLVGLILFQTVSIRAWGPHPTITQAALDALGTNHPLLRLLGSHAQRLTNHCWIADFKRLPFRDVEQDVYADDYLLFPGVAVHFDHICPEVKQAYEPYFRRVLQALRTETPENAARWIGSLLHFVEDSGSPPHAAEIRGPLHLKMENWVDAARISIRGYTPRRLGGDDAAALQGLIRRMDELIAYSKPRGRSLMTPVLLGNRATVEPVALECALETSRVVADLLHTLGEMVGPRANSAGAAWMGRVSSVSAPRFERNPVKIVILGSGFSTLANAEGRFAFWNLPAGRHEVAFVRPGCRSTNVFVTIDNGTATRAEVALGSPGSLIRNGDFSGHWNHAGRPDHWYETPQGWEGEVIPLQAGRGYRLKARFRAGTRGEVVLRWSREVKYDLPQNVSVPRIEARPIRPASPELLFTASETMGLAQVTIKGGRPEEICERVELMLDDVPGGAGR